MEDNGFKNFMQGIEKLISTTEKRIAEKEKTRLRVSKVFDMQDWGNSKGLSLFGYSIFNYGNFEEALGYFFTEEEEIESNTGCNFFMIYFRTNNEGDGCGYVEPQKHEGWKTLIDYARTQEFNSENIIPVDPTYSYLLAYEYILPFKNKRWEWEIEPCKDFDASTVKNFNYEDLYRYP
jgi:hypothetical protein